MEKPNSMYDFTPLSKEQRFVISAYTGCFMILQDEYDDFYKFMSKITGLNVQHYFDLLEPSIWIMAKYAVTPDFLMLMADKETLEANRQLEEKSAREQESSVGRPNRFGALEKPETLTDINDEVLQDVAASTPKTAKEWVKYAKRNQRS